MEVSEDPHVRSPARDAKVPTRQPFPRGSPPPPVQLQVVLDFGVGDPLVAADRGFLASRRRGTGYLRTLEDRLQYCLPDGLSASPVGHVFLLGPDTPGGRSRACSRGRFRLPLGHGRRDREEISEEREGREEQKKVGKLSWEAPVGAGERRLG